MTSKSDIINGFIQAKKSKKNRRIAEEQNINRLLGSQVLHTNRIIKISKMKTIQADRLSRRTTNHGFCKTINEMRESLPQYQQKASFIIHARSFEITSLIVNDLIFNPTLTSRAMTIFFGLNIFYYSICIITNYYYNPLFVTSLLLISFTLGLISLPIKKPNRKR